MAPTVEMCTFARIKQPIKPQQTYNQSSLPHYCLFVYFVFWGESDICFRAEVVDCQKKRTIQISTFLNGNREIAIEVSTCSIKWHALKIISKSTHETVELNEISREKKKFNHKERPLDSNLIRGQDNRLIA